MIFLRNLSVLFDWSYIQANPLPKPESQGKLLLWHSNWLSEKPSAPLEITLYMVNTSRRGASSQKASLVVKNHIQDSVGMWIEASGFVACSSPLPIKMIAGAYPIWHASVDQTNSKVDLWPDQSYKWSPDPLSHLLWHPTLAVRETCQQKTCQRLRGNVWLWG